MNTKRGIDSMKVIIFGANAKEQALASALERTGNHQILVCPGNPGTVEFEQSMEELPDAYNSADILQTAAQVNPDCILILDEYLVQEGWKEKLSSRGWTVISADQKAAQLIDNKPVWSEIMQKNEIPVADFRVFHDKETAKSFIQKYDAPFVFKETDGKKRFSIPYNLDEAEETLDEWFADGPVNLMVSEFLEGPRFNLPVFVSKDRVLPLLPFSVIRGIYENEDDAQTKGMGTICEPDGEFARVQGPQALERILIPLVKELQKYGCPYSGILSGEFIATREGPVCVNLKAGLSETGACALSILMESDLLKALEDLNNGAQPDLKWADADAVSLVLCGSEYPQSPSTGVPIAIDEDFEGSLFQNHVRQGENGLETDGGRVLVVAASGKTVEEAGESAWQSANHIHCDDLYFRSDIGRNPESADD